MINVPEQEFIADKPFEKYGFILQRNSGWVVSTNVPFVVCDHSHTGFEWGYAGSGPSDLALNILENTLRYLRYEGRIGKGQIAGARFMLAYSMHHQFVWDYLANLSKEENSTSNIPFHSVLNFIEHFLYKFPEDFYGNKWDPEDKLVKAL